MSVDVKAHFTCSSDTVVLASGVRVTARRVVSGCETLRDVLVVRVADQHMITSDRVAVHGCGSDYPVGIEAELFFRIVREPSFYLGF